MGPKCRVQLNNVGLLLNARSILDDVSFNINAGEIAAIIGPNGAGKSSLLSLISTERKPTSGTITINGSTLSTKTHTQRARELAVLPQHSALNFPFSVNEVVALSRLPHASGKKIDDDIIAAAIDAMDLSQQRRKNYMQLSGGEKQRTQLARVLAQIWPYGEANTSNTLLLLDEPCSALDAGHQALLMTQLQNLAKQGTAILMVVHDVNFASRYADKIIALKNGKRLCEGSPKAVLNEHMLNTLFSNKGHVFSHPEYGYPVYL